jgi:hypothetical protein
MSRIELRKVADQAVHYAHVAARAARIPKGCFLGITAVGSLLLAILASLSHR